MQVRNAHPFHRYKNQTTVSVKYRLLLDSFLFLLKTETILLTYYFCYTVASAETSVSDSAHDFKEEGLAVPGEEKQPAFKGNKGVRKYCCSSSHFLPFKTFLG